MTEPASPPADRPSRILYTVEEAAGMLGIGRTLMFRLVALRAIESFKIGKRRVIPGDAIRAFVDRMLIEQAAITPAGTQAKIITYALAQLGKPSEPGAAGPDSFDCSGLAMMAYRAADISIPRTSQLQWTFGKQIPATQAQPGHLVFYAGSDGTAAAPGYVGIVYTCATIIVAPTTGQDVEIQPLYQPGLVGFTDPLASR